MNTVKLIGTLPRKPHVIEPADDAKQPVALFTIAARNDSDLGGPQYVEIKAFGAEALLAKEQLTERTKVEVIGYIRSESWSTGNGKNAKKQYRQVVVATYLKALDGALAPDQDEQATDEAAA
jgi:single-stranded DNA-binding protein